MNRSIRHNFIMSVILTSSSFIFPLITFPYIQRVLGPEGTGKVSFATSVLSYFWLIAYLGIPTYGIRACAKARDDRAKLSKLVQELFCISIFTTAVAYLVFFAVLEAVPRFHEDKILYIVISLEFFFYTIGIEWMYRGLEQYTYISINSIIFKCIAVLAMFAFVRSEQDYIIYGALTLFASSASYTLNFFYSRKFVTLRPTEKLDLRQHLKPIMVFAAMSSATMVYVHLDVAMLGFMKNNVDVGYYNAAVKLKVLLVSFVTSLGHVLLPRSSYYVEHGKKQEFYDLVFKGLEFVLVVAVPLSVFFILFAKPVVLFLSGNAYMNAITPMKIIMPTVLLIGLSNLLGIQILVPLGKEKYVLYSVIAGAVTDLILNAIFIPRFASAGAAIGTTVAELVVVLVQYYFLRDELKQVIRRLPFRSILMSLAPSILLALVSFPLSHLFPSDLFPAWADSFLVILLGSLFFFGAYGGLLLLLREPLVCQTWNSIFRKRRHAK